MSTFKQIFYDIYAGLQYFRLKRCFLPVCPTNNYHEFNPGMLKSNAYYRWELS